MVVAGKRVPLFQPRLSICDEGVRVGYLQAACLRSACTATLLPAQPQSPCCPTQGALHLVGPTQGKSGGTEKIMCCTSCDWQDIPVACHTHPLVAAAHEDGFEETFDCRASLGDPRNHKGSLGQGSGLLWSYLGRTTLAEHTWRALAVF